MSQTFFVKRLFPSNLGLSGMHDKYITVPKKVDPTKFFGNPPKTVTCIDKKSGVLYNFPFSLAANGEYRLTQFSNYFDDKKATVNNEIIIEKVIYSKSITYFIDLLRSGITSVYPTNISIPVTVSDEVVEYYPEGSKQIVLLNKYERNTKAREKCIEHYGAVCKACNFDFEINYGEVGKGFIHVHHIIAISDIGKSYKVDPINDLIPICPNCHAMIHQRKPSFTVDEIKEMLSL